MNKNIIINKFIFIACFAVVILLNVSYSSAQSTSAEFSAGSVQLGEDTGACGGGIIGAIRYNSAASGNIDFCDGTNWISLADATTDAGSGGTNVSADFSAGSTIIGNDNRACTGALEGSIRYNNSGSGATTLVALTSGTFYSVPPNWNSSNNTIHTIGAGGDGGNPIGGGAGGGGGAYARVSNITLTPSTYISYSVAAGGSGADTYLCNNTTNCADINGTAVVVGAESGTNGVTITRGLGGLATNSIGSVRYSGGNGGNNAGNFGGGGGGAAGTANNGGIGANAAASQGGNGGSSPGGGGGGTGGLASGGASDGGAGSQWSTLGTGGGGGGGGSSGSAGEGGLYGGGGGGAGSSAGPGFGENGLIVIEYVPIGAGGSMEYCNGSAWTDFAD